MRKVFQQHAKYTARSRRGLLSALKEPVHPRAVLTLRSGYGAVVESASWRPVKPLNLSEVVSFWQTPDWSNQTELVLAWGWIWSRSLSDGTHCCVGLGLGLGLWGGTFSSDPPAHRLNARMTVMSPWWQRSARSEQLTPPAAGRCVCCRGLISDPASSSSLSPRGHPKETASARMSTIPKHSEIQGNSGVLLPSHEPFIRSICDPVPPRTTGFLNSPLSVLRPDPGSEFRFPAAADCCAAPWCAAWGGEVPGAAAVPPPVAPSSWRGRSSEPVLWPELRLRLLPVQRLQSPDPPGTRSRNTTSEPLRESEQQKKNEGKRIVRGGPPEN